MATRKGLTPKHRRSLDALFGPKPRTVPRAAPRRCPNGHLQSATWIRGSLCRACQTEAEQLARGDAAKARAEAERAAWSATNHPGPTMTMVEGRTGRLIVHSIPPHLRKRKRIGRRRRR